jgi:hypothetical protein
MKHALALCLALLLPAPLAAQDVDPRVLRGEHAPPNALWLEQLDLAATTSGPGAPSAGRTVRGNPIVLGRVLHPRGIGIPAPSEWSLPLHGQAVRFLSLVAVPDEAACGEPRPPTLRYVVKADGRVVADSGLVRWGDAPKLLDADLAGKGTLTLAVEVAEGARGDGAWAGALLLLAPESGALRAGARPPSFVKPRESVPGAIPLSQATEAVPWLNGPSLPPGTHALDALLAAPGTAPAATAETPFPMGGVAWTRGVPGVADREIEVDVGGQAHRLMTVVGLLDDATCAASDPGLAAARFQVFADGVKTADSGPIGYGSEPVLLLVDVRDARTLRLVVEGGRAPDREAAGWAGTLLSMAPGTTFVPVARWSAPRPPTPAAAPAAVTGELRQWHPVTLTLDGPAARERDTAPNPFLDYRLTVRFAHESGTPAYDVPGYFAADGRAGETSAEAGTKWRAHVSPDRPGRWTWRASMVRGVRVAVDPAAPGEPVAGVDGAKGSFEVQATDKAGRDFRAQGRLGYVGGHYLRFAGSGRYFLKAGADAPETLLAYADIDGTVATKKEGPLKTWAPHVRDWRPGDPTWKGEKGKGLIGALEYLAGRGMNAVSFLTYNAGGDGDNVWPFVDRDAKLHYDCSKLDQWRAVFEHAQSLGLFLHFKTQETENDDQRLSHERTPGRVPEALDGGAVGVERRLYYRELVARFSHLLALNWNLGEENTQTPEEQRAMAAALGDLDPYDHPVVIHTHPGDQDLVYTPLLGPASGLSGASLQNHWDVAHQRVLTWRRASARAGRPWVVANDEQGDAALGVPPDAGYEGFTGKAREKGGREYDRHDVRRHTLWGTLLAGGAGVEYYFGYSLPQNDLLCEDWRSREGAWDDAAVALRFFEEERVPFWEMEPADALVGNAAEENSRYAFAKRGEVYLVYLPRGGTAELDLRDAPGRFAVSWLDPRRGGRLRAGSVRVVEGGKEVSLGAPPSDPAEDWLAMVRRN